MLKKEPSIKIEGFNDCLLNISSEILSLISWRQNSHN